VESWKWPAASQQVQKRIARQMFAAGDLATLADIPKSGLSSRHNVWRESNGPKVAHRGMVMKWCSSYIRPQNPQAVPLKRLFKGK